MLKDENNHHTYMSPSAVLILENGWIFWGFGIGSKNHAIGELCFNTSQTGYQEILTDPFVCKTNYNFYFSSYRNCGYKFTGY